MKKLLILLTLTGLTFVANAQYRSNDNGYRTNDNSRVRYENKRDRADYRSGRGNEASINSYQRDARAHIAQGIIEGTITSREAAKLLEMAERIEQKENRYARRGGLDRGETRELQNDLKELDRRIWHERKDWDRQVSDDRRTRSF